MRKKKMIRLIILILAIIAIFIVISKFVNKQTDDVKRLANLYNKLNTSQTYLFEMEQNDDNKTIMAKKGNNTLIDQHSKDSRTTTIIKDSNTYLVLHDREEYYVYAQNNIEQNILTDGLSEVIKKDFITGTDKVKGKKYSYEEYAGSTMFMISSTLDSDEEEIRTRFYFDKNDNLVYIQTIKGAKQELLKINLQTEVKDEIFEIPANYAEN